MMLDAKQRVAGSNPARGTIFTREILMFFVIVCLIMVISGVVCAHFGIMYYQVRYYLITAPVLIIALLTAPYIATGIKTILHWIHL